MKDDPPVGETKIQVEDPDGGAVGSKFPQEVALAAEMNGSVDDEPLKESVLMGSVGDRGKQSAPKLQKLKCCHSHQVDRQASKPRALRKLKSKGKFGELTPGKGSGEMAGKRAEGNPPCSAKVDEKRRIHGNPCGGTRNPKESRLGWGIRGRVNAHSEALQGALKRGFESFSRKALRVGQRFIISALPFRRNKRFDEHGR